MGKAVLADFVATFDAETADWDSPREGRVLLNRNQLVLAASENDRVSVRLSRVIDVNPGSHPRTVEAVPGTPVTVAFESGTDRAVAVVSGGESTIERFVTVLFKAVLNGTGAVVKHPAKRGGRVTETSFESASLSLSADGVAFDTGSETVRIDLGSVTDFGREVRRVNGTERPAFVVRHRHSGTALTTVAATGSPRTLSILGRYLRRRYDELLSSLGELSLTEREVETLVTLYSTDGTAPLSGVLGSDQRQVEQLLASLHSDALVQRGGDGPELTTKGQAVVNRYLERVNT